MNEFWDDLLERISDAIKAPVFEVAYRIHYLTTPRTLLEYSLITERWNMEATMDSVNLVGNALIQELTEILRLEIESKAPKRGKT